VASKYTALNGIGYLVVGAILIVWPGVTQACLSNVKQRCVNVPSLPPAGG
jgi:hypothetical protein